jgi:hypothetical protein
VRRRNPPPSRDEAEFFCDRGLGRRVYEALEADGWTVHPMFKVWPRSENSRLDDAIWIPKVTEYGWIILAKDEFDKGNERVILRDSGARAFCIFNASLKAEVMIQRFLNNKQPIQERCAESGPYLYAVQTDRLRKVELP